MPELPEVETVARTLAPAVEGRSLVAVEVLNPKTWQGGVPSAVICAHGPRALAGTGRRGKVLLLSFTPEEEKNGSGEDALTGLAFHLKMTGRLFAYPPGTPAGSHTRAILHLDDGSLLFFDDARKFGYIRALSPKELENWPFWQKLGPEPLEVANVDFIALFRHKKRAMKALLLDQEILAGVGNIYADESLFRAGIRPDTRGCDVSEAALKRLHACLQEILWESIDACGSSIRDYRTARGDAGAFQNAFRVYGRSGQACVSCGKALSQIKVAGRTTVFCPCCQK